MQLQGQTALVIGSACAAGTAIARAFHANGARLGLADQSPTAALAQETSALALPLDSLDDTAFARLAYAAGDALGDIDILVIAIAPPPSPGPMAELAEPDFDRLVTQFTRPLYLAARHFLPAMQTRGRGTLLACAPLPGSAAAARPGWQAPARAWFISAIEYPLPPNMDPTVCA
jgi:3-oxoacyl-[acyl-carrier protein] reductase